MSPAKKNTRRPAGRRRTASAATASDAAPKTGERAKSAGAPPPGTPGGAAFDPVDVLKGFASSTSRVVQQAASILEEELAAGIVAAKQVEERFINVSNVRSQPSDKLMQRFRRDAHEVVDIIVDLLNAGAKSVGSLAQRAVRIRGADVTKTKLRTSTDQVPTVAIPDPVKAGAAAEVAMSVGNDSDDRTSEFSFSSSDLVSATGERISSNNVEFNPKILFVPSHGAEKVRLIIRVPAKTQPGVYAGLIQASNLQQVRAVLTVTIV